MKRKSISKREANSSVILELDNLLTEEELLAVKQIITSLPASSFIDQPGLGRTVTNEWRLPQSIHDRLIDLVSSTLGKKVMMPNPVWSEYSATYGQPNLPPHFDGDFNDFIINFQLESSPNTVWPAGVNLELYTLKDNSAVAFNPNTNAHWRPHRTFKDGEYIQMIFIRFFDPVDTADYSHLPSHPNDPIFAEVFAFRESLRSNV